jgi:hypothetical protein
MNETENQHTQGQSKNIELALLTPEQHAVTPVPKFTTELPFFYLTKQKKLLEQDIRFEGFDGYGNPIRWEVTPNRSPKIGAPSIEAHEIFTRLVKPSMELHRAPDGQIPEILPLGGVRECLRIIGWKEGGWEARGLLQGLMQIGQATCESDFLLPVGSGSDGAPKFRAIKGIFNRFSIWKIGSAHVSEDDITSGDFKFDFDLDDTLYIQLHRIERDIQRSQDQRYLDNAYMFGIEARARRWYELLAAKIFGVVKNGGVYCEINYSWYVKHHHTLVRQFKRFRVVSQMNRVVGDHVAAGFIKKVEYREIKDELGMPDFVIRYYPGNEAKESVRRVLSFVNHSTLPILLARRRKRKERVTSAANALANKIGVDETVKLLDRNSENEKASEVHTTTSSAEGHDDILTALTDRGVMYSVALKILKEKPLDGRDKVRGYIDYWDSIRTQKHPGLLVSLIQRGDPLPSTFETSAQRHDRHLADDRRRDSERINEALSSRYDAYRGMVVEEFIASGLAAGDFEGRVQAEKSRMLQQSDVWARMNPDLLDSSARLFVRGEIAKGIDALSFEAFRAQELPRVVNDLQLDPSIFSTPQTEVSPTDDHLAPESDIQPVATPQTPETAFS